MTVQRQSSEACHRVRLDSAIRDIIERRDLMQNSRKPSCRWNTVWHSLVVDIWQLHVKQHEMRLSSVNRVEIAQRAGKRSGKCVGE